MNRMITLFCFLLATVSILGCANTPTVGDSMKAHGEIAGEIGKQWNEGEKLLKRGEKMHDEGIKLAKEAVQKQKKAEELIARGKKLMAESQTEFSTQFPSKSLDAITEK